MFLFNLLRTTADDVLFSSLCLRMSHAAGAAQYVEVEKERTIKFFWGLNNLTDLVPGIDFLSY
jgi:hypothetical protein